MPGRPTLADCEYCGAKVHPNASFCPSCGYDRRRPPATNLFELGDRLYNVAAVVCLYEVDGRGDLAPPTRGFWEPVPVGDFERVSLPDNQVVAELANGETLRLTKGQAAALRDTLLGHGSGVLNLSEFA